MSTPRFCVYVLARPDGTPFYVGKGTKSRVFDHEDEAQSGCPCDKCLIIRAIWEQGGQIQRTIDFTTHDEHQAFLHERALIARYGRENLANRTDGGRGPSGRRTVQGGVKQGVSSATRDKIRAATKARWADPEARARILAGLNRVSRDPIAVAATSAKLSEANRRRWQDPAYRATMIEKVKASWARRKGKV